MKSGEEQDESGEGLHDFFSQIPDRFIVAEEELDPDVHAEFSSYVPSLLADNQQSAGHGPGQVLFDSAAPIELKREALVRLARSGTVAAYRTIEEYVKQHDPALEQWSKVALYECRMGLETDLLDAPVGIISAGLGGAQHRLRYLVAIAYAVPSADDARRRLVESAWRTACERHDSVLEEVRWQAEHVVLMLLVSMNVAVGTVIEDGIAASNDGGPLLCENYFVTNVAIPTEAEIRRVLNEIPREPSR